MGGTEGRRTEYAHDVAVFFAKGERLGLDVEELGRDLVCRAAVPTRLLEALTWEVVIEIVLDPHWNVMRDVL